MYADYMQKNYSSMVPRKDIGLIAAKQRRARSNDYTYTYCDVFALGELKNSGLPVHPQFLSKICTHNSSAKMSSIALSFRNAD
jgi:hypothetical protein